jgi:glucose/arabinose dehydrogenase
MQYFEMNEYMEAYSQNPQNTGRSLNPEDIYVPPGYRIEVFAQGLDAPSCMIFTQEGELLVAESGDISGNARILRYGNGVFVPLIEGLQVPVSGLAYRDGEIYISQRGKLSRIDIAGNIIDIITGLPDIGGYRNKNIAIGTDGKIYFGVGTLTNSGVVGPENAWITEFPFLHDYPGAYIMLNGQNFETRNFMVEGYERAFTGAFSPYGVPNLPHEVKKGVVKASGSILRVNRDGTDLELYAWGMRNPAKIKFDEGGQLYSVNHCYNNNGSRPIANAPDSLAVVNQGVWYGWPDFAAGEPITLSRFMPDIGPKPEFLLTNHPNIPPKPFAVFPPESHIMGFDFCYNSTFGEYGDIYITEFGDKAEGSNERSMSYAGIGHRVSRININSGGVTTFAINKSGFPAFLSGEGGFGRPIDAVFGPDSELYILDYGTNERNNQATYLPGTGVIWRITREEAG